MKILLKIYEAQHEKYKPVRTIDIPEQKAMEIIAKTEFTKTEFFYRFELDNGIIIFSANSALFDDTVS